MFRLCLFDLDNTLVHTDDLESLRLASKKPKGALLTLIAEALEADEDRVIYSRELLEQIRSDFPELALGVFTRAPRQYVETVLKWAYADFAWDIIISYDDVNRTKPFGDGIDRAMSELKVQNLHEVIVVGDSDADIRSAYHCGCLVALDKGGWPNTLKSEHWRAMGHMPDAIIYRPEYLVEVLKSYERFLPELERLLGDGDKPFGTGRRFDKIGHFIPREVGGDTTSYSNHSVAIIGTREPTAHGVQIAQRISRFFAERGSSIVSGLALGCDAIAHETALRCGGHTVAVLAHGLQMISPSKHKDLAERILESGGALVSEYPFGQSVQAQQFVKRDKTQAGLADGVVMIQSDLKGGSLHASRAALEYGRWLAVPYPTDRDRANDEPKIQANLLIADGAPGPKTALLRCRESALSHIVVLRSKEDYQRLLETEPARPTSSESIRVDEEGAFAEGSANDSMPGLRHTEPDDDGNKPQFMTDVPHTSPGREHVANNVMLLVRWEHQKALSVSDALATIEKFKSSAPSADTESVIDIAYRICVALGCEAKLVVANEYRAGT
ncbi:DNA-processing protein DprA [Klebsiella pneumoniae]|uniref:DNA-processing protein DprA n=1 Tax=Enterobacteriaceae TaxID=543 RepID=UPI00200522C5|nr:DNA-processing protein DprA [Enterobacter roggenkampii]MCK6844201.1 DNA-processing protein DprA [Enterobacter roggenkampii]